MNPIRVMVVDDSVVVRKIVTDVLSADPGIEVVGTAVNGKVALGKLEQLKPDLITMDIEMPEMNGIEAVRAIRGARNRVPIVMFSTLTERGATATLDALSAGANDYVTKPANVGSVAQSMESVREQLIPRIKALTGRPMTPSRATTQAPPPPPPRPAVPRTGPGKKPAVLVIGSSTGGPEALARVLPALPATLPVPVLLAQHMPPVFTRQFAQRLDRLSPLRVVEAVDGTPLVPGTVHLAPGDHHLVVRANGRAGFSTSLNQGPPENFCRPAVDPLFRSAVAAFDGAVLGVVLTGMGADGRNGCGEIRNAGGTVVVQDQATSVVWGMPGAVAQAGYADEVLPLDRIAEAIQRHLAGTAPLNNATAMAVGGRR
ncbi:chemotaxis response regulator protein-glutamate methylesterase [Blastococcus sp. SYSU DS0753]